MRPLATSESRGAQPVAQMSGLIESLSEFLASRNSSNRYDCYAKIVAEDEDEDEDEADNDDEDDSDNTEADSAGSRCKQLPSRTSRRSGCKWHAFSEEAANERGQSKKCDNYYFCDTCPNVYGHGRASIRPPSRKRVFTCASSPLGSGKSASASRSQKADGSISGEQPLARSSNRSRRRISSLLVALLNPRKQPQESRASLLISLLRAPIVLAALFSLALCISLIVLYALTYLQQHASSHYRFYSALHLHRSFAPTTNRTTEAEDRMLNLTAATSTASAPISRAHPSAPLHHIGSRHLLAAPATSDGLERDRSVETAEERNETTKAKSKTIEIETECFRLKGRRVRVNPSSNTTLHVAVFKGVPYASAPVGPLRWALPRPIWLESSESAGRCKGRNVTMDALRSRSHCPQLSPLLRRFTGSEDCLYLDIYAPLESAAEQQVSSSDY